MPRPSRSGPRRSPAHGGGQPGGQVQCALLVEALRVVVRGAPGVDRREQPLPIGGIGRLSDQGCCTARGARPFVQVPDPVRPLKAGQRLGEHAGCVRAVDQQRDASLAAVRRDLLNRHQPGGGGGDVVHHDQGRTVVRVHCRAHQRRALLGVRGQRDVHGVDLGAGPCRMPPHRHVDGAVGVVGDHDPLTRAQRQRGQHGRDARARVGGQRRRLSRCVQPVGDGAPGLRHTCRQVAEPRDRVALGLLAQRLLPRPGRRRHRTEGPVIEVAYRWVE